MMIYLRELAHMIVGRDKSKIHRAGWELRQELMLQSGGRISYSLEESQFFLLKPSTD